MPLLPGEYRSTLPWLDLADCFHRSQSWKSRGYGDVLRGCFRGFGFRALLEVYIRGSARFLWGFSFYRGFGSFGVFWVCNFRVSIQVHWRGRGLGFWAWGSGLGSGNRVSAF